MPYDKGPVHDYGNDPIIVNSVETLLEDAEWDERLAKEAEVNVMITVDAEESVQARLQPNVDANLAEQVELFAKDNSNRRTEHNQVPKEPGTWQIVLPSGKGVNVACSALVHTDFSADLSGLKKECFGALPDLTVAGFTADQVRTLSPDVFADLSAPHLRIMLQRDLLVKVAASSLQQIGKNNLALCAQFNKDTLKNIERMPNLSLSWACTAASPVWYALIAQMGRGRQAPSDVLRGIESSSIVARIADFGEGLDAQHWRVAFSKDKEGFCAVLTPATVGAYPALRSALPVSECARANPSLAGG